MAESEEEIYEAVRGAWVITLANAKKAEVVLAHRQGVIIGVFVAEEWISAEDGFSHLPKLKGRLGFVGKSASKDVRELYLEHRIPASLYKRGAANPVRYSWRQT